MNLQICKIFVDGRLLAGVWKTHMNQRDFVFLQSCRSVQVRPLTLADVHVPHPSRPESWQELKVHSYLLRQDFGPFLNRRESSLPCTSPDWPGGAVDDDLEYGEYDVRL